MAAVEVAGLVKIYDDRRVVDDVSFSVDLGEIFGIVGPNGAGKTTIVESIAGLREPDGGSISVLGLDPGADHFELAQRLGVQLQESQLQPKIRVGEALETFASFYDAPADWRELMARFDLEEKVDTAFADLSGGMKQKLSAALALVGSPEMVILDELTTGLDPRARRSTWATVERIRDAGVTVLLVTHFMDEAERLCDRIMVVHDGQVAAIDSPDGLASSAGYEQRMTFVPTELVAPGELAAIPDVVDVAVADGVTTVAGVGDVVVNVLTTLLDRGVRAERLRVEQAGLEDAYLAITGERSGSVEEPA
jgi:ABC-2 type transport system ATP-binding protein